MLLLLSLLLVCVQGLDSDTSSLSAELRQLQASIKAEQEGLKDFREVRACCCCARGLRRFKCAFV